MTLKVKDAYFPTQNAMVYTGQITGKITDKNKLFLGRLIDLPALPKNKRFNLRVRGSDSEGNRYLPLQCHARTDGAGDLYIQDKYAPQIDHTASITPDDPHSEPVQQPPKPRHLALVINNIVNPNTPPNPKSRR